MNRLSTSFFGHLFYLRNGPFATRGIPYAQKHGSYYEIFSLGSMRHSVLQFKLKRGNQFGFESTLDLNGKLWEHYKFETSPYGAKETYDLFEVKDGWFERSLAWEEVKPLVLTLKQSEHIVHDSSR